METVMEWLGGYIWATAFVLGAIHALQPGHGKTIVAAYLVGARGTVRDAVMLGIVVTITHTLTIYVLAALAGGGMMFLPMEELERYLGAFAALLIVLVGLSLVYTQFRRRAARRRAAGLERHDRARHNDHEHEHPHGHGHHHEHPHGHVHAHGPHHDHEHSHFPGISHSHGTPEDMTSLSRIFLLGISGGIVPCPEGLAVFLASIAGGRIETGLLLVMVFSLGLAGTLVAVGILFLKASSLFAERPGAADWGYRIAWISAILITVVGVGYFLRYLLLFWE